MDVADATVVSGCNSLLLIVCSEGPPPRGIAMIEDCNLFAPNRFAPE